MPAIKLSSGRGKRCSWIRQSAARAIKRKVGNKVEHNMLTQAAVFYVFLFGAAWAR